MQHISSVIRRGYAEMSVPANVDTHLEAIFIWVELDIKVSLQSSGAERAGLNEFTFLFRTYHLEPLNKASSKI